MLSKLRTMIEEEAAKQGKILNLGDLLKAKSKPTVPEEKKQPGNEPISPSGSKFRMLPFIIVFILLFAGYNIYTAVVDSEPVRVSEEYIRRSPEIAAAVGRIKEVSLTYPFSFDIGGREARVNVAFDVAGTSDAVTVYLILIKAQGPWQVAQARYKDSRGIVRPLKTGREADEREAAGSRTPVMGDGRENLTRGHAFFKANDFAKAAAEYGNAVQANPSDYQGYYWRGIALAKMNRDDAATADFRKVVELVPGHPGAFNWLGWLHSRNQRYDEAIADFTKSISLRGNQGWTYYQRGQCYVGKGLRARAVADFEKACSLKYSRACPAAEKLKTDV